MCVIPHLKADGANNAFVSGPLTMFSGVTLWIDANTTLFASRNPRDFDVEPGACGTDEFDDSGGCRALINVDTLDDVGVVGEGTIDGRGGEPMMGGHRDLVGRGPGRQGQESQAQQSRASSTSRSPGTSRSIR